MPQWLEGWPFLGLYLFFVLGAALRSQALYWAGRGVTAGVLRTRLADRLEDPRARRALEAIERWGMPVVPLSFLTVGFQSAVHTAAGLLRIGWLRYTLWSVPGWLVWALVWTTGGIAAAAAAVALAARSPWTLVAVVVVLAGAGVLLGRRRAAVRPQADVSAAARRRSGSPPGPT